MSELKHMHAKTECLPFNTEDVRLIITERYGKQEIRMHGGDARFIVEAIAAAKRRTQPEAAAPAIQQPQGQDRGIELAFLGVPCSRAWDCDQLGFKYSIWRCSKCGTERVR